ncbi:MAG: DUF2142 domain-containing protein [Atopobiaceae bacterium]|nr:DUF2142 domain-containing protein [Atopobiaceae bacterium]
MARHIAVAQNHRHQGILGILASLLVALIVAVLLEAGTLAGAPALSPLHLSEWNLVRLFVFFLLALFPSWKLTGITKEDLTGRWRQWSAEKSKPFMRAVGKSVLALVAGMLFGEIIALVSSRSGLLTDSRLSIVASAITVPALLILLNRKLCLKRVEWGYLAIALPVGTALCLLMPQAAEISFDGQTHFNCAQAMSYVLDAEYTGADRIMTWAGTGIGALTGLEMEEGTEFVSVELGAREVPYPHADQSEQAHEKARQIIEDAEVIEGLKVLSGPQRLGGVYVSARNLGLIPNAIGLWIGRLLGLGPSLRFVLGRLANLYFYAIMFFFAIRQMKSSKLVMVVLGLIPSSLLLAANYSYDPWHISLIALAFASFVGLMQSEREISATDVWKVLVPFTLGALVKAVVFPLALVFLMVPQKRFSSNTDCRRWRMAIGTMIALPVLGILTAVVLSSLKPDSTVLASVLSSDMRGGEMVSASGQIAYIVGHPLETLRNIGSLIAGMLNPAISLIGLGASDENLVYYSPYLVPTFAPLTEVCALFASTLLIGISFMDRSDEDKNYTQASIKVMSTCGFIVSFAFIALALYITFTDVGRNTISGVQYRYLLPLLPAVFLIVFNTRVGRKAELSWLPAITYAAELVLWTLVLINSFVVWF